MANTKRIRSSEVDFGTNSLPKNRAGLFFSLLRRRFLLFFALTLLSILFIGPAIIFETIGRTAIFGNLPTENMNITEAVSFVLFSSLIGLALNFLLCLGFSGLIHILQKLAYEKIVFISDFFVGMKNNMMLSVLFDILLTIGCLIYKLCFILSINNSSFNILRSVGFGFSILLLITVITIAFISYIQNSVYELNIRSILTNSFKFYLNGLLIYASIITISFFFIFSIMFGSFVVDSIFGILLVILSPEISLVFILYTNSKFDYFINKDNYPELVDIGINRAKNN